MSYASDVRLSWNKMLDSLAVKCFQPFLTLLRLMLRPGEVIEVRLVEAQNARGDARRFALGNGYYTDSAKLAATAMKWEGQVEMIAFTINPVRRSLLSAAENQLRRPAGWLSDAGDVTRRCLLPISFQANAPGDQDLHSATLDLAHECRDWLTAQGWPEPVVADSVSAAHLLYSIDLPNDGASTELIKQVLTTLNKRFSNDRIGTDANASDAALLLPLFGTLIRQPNPAPEVLYRRSAILTLPDRLQPVDFTLLEALCRLPVAAPQALPLPSAPVAGDPISQFVQTRCVLGVNAWTPTGILYDGFRVLCYERGLPTVAAPQFAKALITRFELEPERRKVKGVVTRGLWGILLKHSLSDDHSPG